MKIKNLLLLSLTAIIALSSCGKKSDKKKEEPKYATELNGVWGMGQAEVEVGIYKTYLEFLNNKDMKVHVRCIFNSGENRHAKGDVEIDVDEAKKTVSFISGKKFSDSDANFICEGSPVLLKDFPYEITSIDGKKALNLGGNLLLQADLKEKLERKTIDETTQYLNPFVDIKATVTTK